MDPKTLNGPAAMPPPNVMPNFVNPPNGNAGAVAVIIIALVISTTCLSARLYSKWSSQRKLNVEDGLGICAYGFFVGIIWCGFSLWKTIGFFVQQYNVRLATLFDALYVLYLFPLFYALTMMTVKAAILLEWMRIFVPARTRNSFFWICWAMIIVNCLFYIATIIAVQFYCTPVEKNWHRWVPGSCRDRSTIDITPTAFNLVLDIMILLLPQRVIWKLQLQTHRKIGVSVVFSVGLLACICAAARIAYTVRINYASNVTYDSGPVYLWSLAECTCGLLIFSVPALPKAFADSSTIKFLKGSLKSWGSSTSRSSKKGTASESTNSGHHHHAGEVSSTRSLQKYQTMSDYEQGYSLSEVSGTPSVAGGSDVEEHQWRPQTVILRTTEVTTGIAPAPAGIQTEWYEKQQPWATPTAVTRQ